MSTEPNDIRIRTGDTREGLQALLDGLPMIVATVADHQQEEGVHEVRVLRGIDFLRFAFEQQGYGEILDQARYA